MADQDDEPDVLPALGPTSVHEQEAWHARILELQQIQEKYNKLLGSLDHSSKTDPIANSLSNVTSVLDELNRAYGQAELSELDTATPFSLKWWAIRLNPKWWMTRFVKSVMGPHLSRARVIDGVTIHCLNELRLFLLSQIEWHRNILQAQMSFLLEITPCVDAKVNELRSEQNHNVAVHVSQLQHVQIPNEMQSFNSQLQKQLEIMEYRIMGPTTGISIHDQLRVDGQEITDLRRQVEDLWHQVLSASTAESRNRASEQQKRIQPSPEHIKENEAQDPERPKESASVSEGSHTLQDDLPADRDLRYFVFEELFRGPQELVRDKLKYYTQYFINAQGPVLDIGCGRGEFLSLMKENGINAYGVDLNGLEVKQLNSSGLKAVEEDALRHIQKLEKETLGGGFTSQVVEHLSPDQVLALIRTMFVALKPGAPLIIETLNPLSVYSFHSYYLLDPTHQYPIHPETLAFWMRYAGFQGVKLHMITPFPKETRLPEPDGVPLEDPVWRYLQKFSTRLNDVLFGNAEFYVVGYRP